MINTKLKYTNTYYIKNYETTIDDEGNVIKDFINPKMVVANINVCSGQMEAQLYGKDLKYYYNMYIKGNYNITSDGKKLYYNFKDFIVSENDGVCYLVDKDSEPDCIVESIKPYPQHIKLTLKRLI